MFDGKRLSVDAARSHGIIGVNDGEDTGTHGNIFSSDTARVAFAVPTFVVSNHDFGEVLEDAADLCQNLASDLWMETHDDPFLVGQWASLVQDGIGDTDFTNVVEQRSQ